MRIHYISMDAVSINNVRNGATQYRIVMNPQPKADAKFISFYVYDGDFHVCDISEDSVLGLREPWAESDEGIVFMSDGVSAAFKAAYMLPKEKVRYFVRVKSIRAERLKCVSNEDLQKNLCLDVDEFKKYWRQSVRQKARTYNKYGIKYKWDDDPWVWVLDIEKEERPLG